jgi:class 3 adenylate cyclase
MERRLAAILAADVAGYSRLMASDETGTLARLNRFRTEVIEPRISEFGGHIVGSAGDSLLVEFTSAVNAVECAAQMQAGLAAQNSELPNDQRMAFRIGVNLGDVIAESGTIYGDGVNIASRLEKLAEPGGICIGRNVRSGQEQARLRLCRPWLAAISQHSRSGPGIPNAGRQPRCDKTSLAMAR